MTNREKFQTILTDELTHLFQNDPAFGKTARVTSPAHMAEAMTRALGVRRSSAHLNGPAVVNTCRRLGITGTYIGILNYLTS